jgi:hypothetical protein
MKTLEQEAQEHFDNNIFCDGITPFEEDISKRCFIAGANSKWVQAEKIKAQIEVLTGLYANSYIKSGREFWKKKFEELEQQHRQLEDE